MVSTVEAHGDQFLANTAAMQFDHGGLVVVGIEKVAEHCDRAGAGREEDTRESSSKPTALVARWTLKDRKIADSRHIEGSNPCGQNPRVVLLKN
jgi:hypothetical protein